MSNQLLMSFPLKQEEIEPDYIKESRSNLIYELSHDEINIENIVESYHKWVNHSEFMVLEAFDQDRSDSEFIAVKCAKRGNDVYQFRTENKLKDVYSLFRNNDTPFFMVDENKPKVKCLYLTLTYDSKICSLTSAWQNIGKEYNAFVSRLKRKYGDITIFRAFEAFESGYPHIHAIILFNDHEFSGFRYQNDEYRVEEKDEISDMWHSFIDVSAVQSLGKSGFYLTKYISKVNSSSEPKHQTTLAMLWLFNKQSYSVSSQFAKQIEALRVQSHLHNSNKKPRFQTNLFGGVNEKTYIFHGIFDFKDIWACRDKENCNPRKDVWTYRLKDVPKEKQDSNDEWLEKSLI